MVLLFEHVKQNYSTYPEILGYFYLNDPPKDLDTYDYVFISSDGSAPLPTSAIQMMTSAEEKGTYMWLEKDFSDLQQLPPSEFTETPTVGFVGRIPMLPNSNGEIELHRGFEQRYLANRLLEQSTQICYDAHPRYDPLGDSAGFWNESIPNRKKWEPLFKTNLLANQYNLCTRGNANWSLRFFETLAYGRIPVYVESGGRLPWDQAIDYFDGGFPVVTNILKIEQTILEFHETHDLKKTQCACRKMYDDYFSQEAQIRLFDEFPPL